MFKNLLKGIARAFTVPASVRRQINALPITPVLKETFGPELVTAIGGVVDKNFTDPTANLLVKTELAALINASGILK